MSRDLVTAKRYAKALFDVAQQQGIVSEVEEQLKLIAETLRENADVQKVLASPGIASANKVELLRGAFADSVSAIVMNTLELLIARGRQHLIPEVYESFVRIAGEKLNKAQAIVYTARQLSNDELNALTAHFAQVTGKSITAEQVVEPALIGGVKVRIGDTLYDGSLSGKLDRLAKSMGIQAL
ncbi:F0F1 ATP synthase subunit delta [Paenibacillus cisolokensis]|jgi:ATP synthase, F1 delta subunit|uniref:ATP synthase subunit delta n=1 Tax=Paenibacillus cisolokensis TaxID=1658519 RepID=A0ABQ4N1A4_9BACL|nr:MULTISPECIES: F0F1 ATP synthase subunit delta [Paenibacillus]ALS26034.1 subunit delta of F0F1 ATP synthase [Paenibacillus sp. 32O-W]GIQ61958.1 ATP synthase subunit delta [Paenibacillus cisolokensis]